MCSVEGRNTFEIQRNVSLAENFQTLNRFGVDGERHRLRSSRSDPGFPHPMLDTYSAYYSPLEVKKESEFSS